MKKRAIEKLGLSKASDGRYVKEDIGCAKYVNVKGEVVKVITTCLTKYYVWRGLPFLGYMALVDYHTSRYENSL
jgi:hypothetical protein